ncbi:hypothetical protein FAGKG844_20274 [Frankia sp. AgKG'84/4]
MARCPGLRWDAPPARPRRDAARETRQRRRSAVRPLWYSQHGAKGNYVTFGMTTRPVVITG